jgi:hypothetical protein
VVKGDREARALLLTADGRFDFDEAFREQLAAQQSLVLFAYSARNFGPTILERLVDRNEGYVQEFGLAGNEAALRLCRDSAAAIYADIERLTKNTSLLCSYAMAESVAKAALHIASEEEPDEIRHALLLLDKLKSAAKATDEGLLNFVDGTSCGLLNSLRILEIVVPLSSMPARPSVLNSFQDDWKYDYQRFVHLGEERRHIAHENLLRIPGIDVEAECGYVADFLWVINLWLNSRFDRGKKWSS